MGEFLRRKRGSVGAQALQVQIRVASLLNHREEHRILFPHGLARGFNVLRGLNHRRRCLDVIGDAHLRTGLGMRANGLHREPMRETNEVVQLRDPLRVQREPRGMLALAIAQLDEAANFIHRHEMPHAVGERTGEVAGIVAEGARRVPVLPSARVLERLWQVPMEDRAVRLNTGRKQGIDKLIVEVDSLLIRLAPA